MKNTMIKDTLSLFVITLIAGALLGFVYDLTREPIRAAENAKKQEAYGNVFTGVASFEENEELTAAIENLEDVLAAEGITSVYISEVLEAKDASGATMGYVMNFGSNAGYGGAIDMSLGVTTDSTLTGVSVLSMSETVGLGSKCTEPDFLNQFTGIKADSVAYSKTGKAADNEIDAIGGATITTKAVTSAVNGALAFLRANGAISQ